MYDGAYTFYTIQFKTSHQSEWRKPKGELRPIKGKQWHYLGSDSWGKSINPKIGTGNSYRPKYKKAHEELFEIQMACDYSGWYSLKYALAALSRLVKDDAQGMYDSFCSYKTPMAAVRHEFRLVKITMHKTSEILGSITDPLLRETLKANKAIN